MSQTETSIPLRSVSEDELHDFVIEYYESKELELSEEGFEHLSNFVLYRDIELIGELVSKSEINRLLLQLEPFTEKMKND